MQKTYNTSHVRQINQRAVLDSILRNGSMSKAELARTLGLSKPAMADNVQRLLDLGIVKEGGEGGCGPNGGRRPVMLMLNGEHKYIVTIDFFYTFTRFILGNIKGEVVEEFSVNQTPAQSFEAWVNMSVNAVNTLLFSRGLQMENLAAIGFSAPGVVSSDQRCIIPSAMGGNFDAGVFVERLKENFHCIVYTKNSANVYVVAEVEAGAGKGFKNVLYISCGEGIGAGIILNGQLYEGSGMAAGEIGNFVTRNTLDEPNRLEQRIGVQALMRLIREQAPAQTLEKLDLQLSDEKLFLQVVNLWKEGDRFLKKCVEEISLDIGCIVADMNMLLNCDIIILGGEYIAFSSQMIPVVQNIVNTRCYLPPKVVPAALGKERRGLGMLALCREFYFDTLCGLASAP